MRKKRDILVLSNKAIKNRLYCSEPVRLVRCRANQIMKMAEEAMYKRPDSVTLVYSSLTYFELVVGSNTAKFTWG